MDLDVMLIIRIFNVAGCVFALWALTLSAYRSWSTWNSKTKMHWWALFGWVFLGFAATIESLVQNHSAGPRTIIQTLVVAWTINALLVNEPISAQSSLPWRKEQDDG